MPIRPGEFSAELIELIGEEASFALAENYAGTRLYIPAKAKADDDIAQAIGLRAAKKLSERYAPDVIRIPLMRELRVARYREQGYSCARIAVRLGMTEPGVNQLIRRLVAQGKAEPRN